MARRRRPSSPEDDRDRVGYGKPPVHSRFQPGQSGNPAGRPKGVCNLRTDVNRILLIPVKVKSNGKIQTRTTLESSLLVLREKALQGDMRALDRIVALAQRFNDDLPDPAAAQPLSADDQALLEFYAAERVASANTQPPAPHADPVVEPDGRPGRRRPR